jgi:penicillin-binding protein 1A
MTKAEILELYLNRIFLGNGAYGISAAARRYFDKRLDQLTLPEMALIAGLARAPSRYNPFQRPERALKRRNVVLARMMEQGYISKKRYQAALRQGRDADGSARLGLQRRPDFFHDVAPYFTAHVKRLLIRRFGRDRLDRGGLRVETSLDTAVHAAARRHVDELARWVDKRQGWRGPVAWLGDEEDREQFRRESKAYYGTGALERGRRYLGLVERSTSRAARVTVAGRTYTLPRRFLRWGARFYTRSAINDRCIRHAWLVLIPGDVVWVRLAPEDLYDPRIPGSDGQPCITSGHYQEPARHLRDGKPPGPVDPLELPRGEGWPGPPYLALEQVPRVQGSLYSYDLRTGYVKAMVGGTDYDRSNFNRITQACRQPGSTYKPVYYSLALHRGMSFYKKLKDKPHSIVDPETGRIWYTYDYQHDPELRRRFASRLEGYTRTLEQALVWSKNKASMHLFCELGPQSIKNRYARCNRAAHAVKAWARRLGFTTEIITDQALGLGASCTRTDELTRAFAAFAYAGKRVEPVYIRRILDRKGRVLLDRSVPWDPMLSPGARFDRLYATAGQRREQLIPPKTAHRTATLLRKVISQGHAEVVRMTRIPTAGKTGTASRTADTWLVGHTSRWITTAWLGDDHYVRSLGRHDASFTTAQPMWARFMYEVASHHPLREIPFFDEQGRRMDQNPIIPANQPDRHKPDYQPHFKRRKASARRRRRAAQRAGGTE